MAPVAANPVVLGHHGEIPAGAEIPETFLDIFGHECATDFKRLEALGVIEVGKVAAAAKNAVKRVRGDAAAKNAAEPAEPEEPVASEE